ncbi:hypothetical protein [Jeotgalicoccus psychrophilus]|uniref:hypothetical protein n=1 Tax=Jeotgalicoccus psychrophilus TaxID=157228 RepID=UPI00041AB5E7|nr:hypothetical protein [Jeotgalicoccus psychrophilus]
MELENHYQIEQKINDEGDYKSFSYQNVFCEIKRIKGMGHLCGYLHLDSVTDDAREIINEHFHCGITYEHDDVYGFDCTHVGDINPAYLHDPSYPEWPGETYKTMRYVEVKLKNSLDALVEKGML